MPMFRALLRVALPLGLCASATAAGLTVLPASGPEATLTRAPGSATAGPVQVQRVGSALAMPATALRTTAYGYVRATPGLLGETPRGLHVWVDRGARHRANLVRQARATIAVWRDAGLNATYEGLGTPRRREGIVTLSEGSAGCEAGTARVGNTWQSWRNLPDGKAYMHSARIVICPRLYRYARWQWSATVRHELGHAAGLGHFDSRYKGSTQLMRWANKAPVSSFKAGDLNGLRFFARNNDLVRQLIPPRGSVDRDIGVLNRVVTLTGWAKLDWYPAKPVRIVVTESGRRLASTLTDGGHRFAVMVPRSAGEHTLHITAVSPLNPAARQKLGWATVTVR